MKSLQSTALCPVCASKADAVRAGTPYRVCSACDHWYQHPPPPKTLEASHEKTADGGFAGHLMSDHDRAVNRALAGHLVANVIDGRRGSALDVGSKYPFLSRCLADLGMTAWGLDDIAIVPEYSRALEVPMILGDFERLSVDVIRERTGVERFDLITIVHVFEHLYDPSAALRKLRGLVSPDGRIFVRLPSHDVAGFERDLTPGHYEIHPHFYALSSFLELLARAGDLFVVESGDPLEGAGQRDLVLRPIDRRPTIAFGMIVKNEERDLPRALGPIPPMVDTIHVVDTGSADRTVAIAEGFAASLAGSTVETFTGASRLEDGDWKLYDFAAARNVTVERAEQAGADWFVWLDADDVLLDPGALRRHAYLERYPVHAWKVRQGGGGDPWIHHRMWRLDRKIRFAGAVHEYPLLGGHEVFVRPDVVVQHYAAPTAGEDSTIPTTW